MGFCAPDAPLSSAEFVLWGVYWDAYGFDAERVEWTVANAGSAAARHLNAKPADLVAKFEAAPKKQGSTPAEIMAFFDRLAAKSAG